MDKVRVVHYLNQFYAGLGGEEKADVPPQVKEGTTGPGQLLSKALGNKGELVGTVFCGDNYANEKPEAIDQIIEMIKSFNPGLVIAGPAFASGRNGLACGAVCDAAQKKLGIPAVTGMHPDNPGAEKYKSEVYIVLAGKSGAAMAQAMPVMAKLGLKLAFKEAIGSPEEEGYLPQGYRRPIWADTNGAHRAVDMLLKRVKGDPFVTERPLPKYEYIPPAAPVRDLRKATIALVTEGGCVPRGNPDRIEASWATKWAKYPIRSLPRLVGGDYLSIHGGIDTTYVNEDPNRLVPLDVVRDMEKEGIFAKLYDYLYSTCGSMGNFSNIGKFGKEIAEDLKRNKVDAVILTGT